MARDIIVINGAPGVGKSTVADGLKTRFGWPVLELGFLRMAYLDPQWKSANAAEAQMAFEILCHAAWRFVAFGLRNTVLVDLLPEHVAQVADRFAGMDRLIVSLVVADRGVLESRVTEPTRDSGYRDVPKAWAWNNAIRSRPLLANEVVLDTTADTVEQTIARVAAALGE